MKAVFALAAIGLGLAAFATPSTGVAQACKQTLDMTPNGGPKMVQCHEVTDMPPAAINGMCRPAGAQARTVPEQLEKCPSAYVGLCVTPLRTIQANIRRMQGLAAEVDPNVPETAMIKAYFYEGMPPNASDVCTRSGGKWMTAQAPAATKKR
jgi:putative hemolysin